MKNSVLKYLAVGVLVAGFACSMQAVLVTGSIQMAGSVTLNTTDLATASVASFSNPAGVLSSGTGSYFGIPTLFAGPQVDFFGFNIVAGAQAVTPLWSFMYLGNTYTFDLSQINSVGSNLGSNTRSSTDLLIKGTGTVMITGGSYTPTGANWSFDVTDTSGTGGTFTFGFSQSDTASVPEGGTTVMLLGAALSGLGLIRRKLA